MVDAPSVALVACRSDTCRHQAASASQVCPLWQCAGFAPTIWTWMCRLRIRTRDFLFWTVFWY